MSTTIDSLQIQIRSTSTRAAEGIRNLSSAMGELKKNSSAAEDIRNLSSAMGELKKNGSVTTAINNLNKLSTSLQSFVQVHSSVSKISELAASVERLKTVGSVSTLSNSLSKMGTALNSLGAVNIETVGPKLQTLATALAPLSSLKAGGFTSMIRSLGKINDVTASLSDDKIEAFADRIRRLVTVMEPLSAKMTTVQSGLRAIGTAAQSAGSSTRHMGDALNTSSINMMSFIYNLRSVIYWTRRVVTLFSNFVSEAVEWDGISARFGRGFGDQASETYSWLRRLNEEMGINIQQFMQYSSIYSTMLEGFGVASADAAQMALGYTELTYDIWAGYNDVYKTFADASEAVKSAISGEVKSIRRAGFTIVESTLKQTAANHGLKISLANATEAQKSYLRYLTMVDQAHAQSLVGAYAKELGTAEGLIRTLSQQLKSFAQALGSLFLPVLARIIPYLQTFVELLTDGIIALAALFGIEIQGVDWSEYNSGVGNAASGTEDLGDAMADAASAAKDLQNATIGIDELNVISPQSGSGGGGSGGGASGFDGLDVDSLWDESIFKNINDQIDTIKEKFQEWLPVIETIGIALGALAVLSLIESLGNGLATLNTMTGMVATLKQALAAIAILTIEAVLVFKLADEYLETGNPVNLLGEALTTATAGYLMYRGFGDKGLIAALAVSVIAQLASIALNLADGGVSIDDPQLWIQSAFTSALVGVGGGWLAYKGIVSMSVGQGVGFGLLAGISVTLASITIGEVTANGFDLTTAITGALSTLLGGAAGAGILTALGVASGGTAFLIGAAVMLVVNLVGILIGSISRDTEADMEKSLEERFGEIELSVSEIEVIVERLVPAWTDEVALAVDLREGLASLLDSIQTQVNMQEGYEWRVAVGIDLTEDEMGQYKNSIDTFIAQVQQYVSDRGYALEVGLKATGASESIIASANAISAAASEELESLGKQLQDTVNAAYEDGLLDIDELEAIRNIRNDMMEIQNVLASSNIEAEFSLLEMKWSGVDLTSESYSQMMEEWNKTIENDIKPALEATVSENLSTLEANIAFAQLKYDQAETTEDQLKWADALRDAEKALQDYINENPLENLTLEASFRAVTFALNTLQEAFQEELELARSEGWFDYELGLESALVIRPGIKFDDGAGDIYGNLELLVYDIAGYMEFESASLSKAARDSLEEMIEAMKPTMEDYEDLAAANRKCGQTVTQSIREGLNDYNELQALAGDQEAINYMIGKGFSTDPTFLNTLATSVAAGEMIDASVAKGLLNNINYVKDEASGVIVGIKNAVTGEVTYITPTLKKNLEDLGVNMGDALGDQYQYVYDETTGMLEGIVDATTGNMVWINDELEETGKSVGAAMPAGMNRGAINKMNSQKRSIKGWSSQPWDWFKEENDIENGSSGLFESGGAALISGLLAGMPVTSLSTHLSTLWDSATSWWNKKPALSTYTPTIGSIQSKVSAAWSTAREWWENKKTKMTEYTPSIGSIQNKISTAWNAAREWWDNKKTGMNSYTPTIGSIKDALISAWNAAKTWWNNNVKLSIPPLSFKVTYTSKDSLGSWQKAIVNALNLPGWPSLSFAADGGIFDAGSLIWAGERGAEVVANAGGGRTGVMNVQQMQDAVYEGVYAAVVAANRSGNGGDNPAVNVYLDGRQITAVIEKRQRERGANILGNAVYSR